MCLKAGGAIMRAGSKGKKGVVGLIVTVLLLAPSLVQAKGKSWEHYKEHKEKIIKELKLTPDKAKEFQQVDEKYAKARQEIYASLKKDQAELKQAMAASKPDEAKVKDLVSSITSEQDKLMDSFKSQRNDELALLTPLQQGKYLMALGDWRHEMIEKYKEKMEKK
jgi:Spy/CpxP family protein refolding chaperone